MKKFTSILCALAMVLSVTAAPSVGKFANQEKVVKKELAQKSMVNALPKLALSKSTPAKAPKATAEAAPLTSGTYYTVGGKFYMYGSGGWNDRTSYMPSVTVAVNGNQVSITGLAYWFEEAAITGTMNGNTLTFPSGQLVGSDEYGDEFLIGFDDNDKVTENIIFTYDPETQTLSATTPYIGESASTTELQLYTYWLQPSFSAQQKEAPKGGTFVADYVYAESASDTTAYVLSVSDEDLAFYFVFPLGSLESGKTYTYADLAANSSAILFNESTVIWYKTVSFTKTDAADGSYTISVTIVDANGDTWNITGSKAAPSKLTFSLQVTDSSIIVIPSSNDELWEFYPVSAAYLSQIQAAGYGAADLANYVYSQAGTQIAGKGSYEILFDLLAEYYELSGECVLLVWGCNETEITTAVSTVAFTVPEKEVIPSDMTFEISVTATGVLVTPSNDVDPWQATFYTAEQYQSIIAAGYTADQIAAYDYQEYGDDNAYPEEYEYTFAELQEDFGMAPGNYYIIVYGANGGVTTPATAFAFTIPGDETGIEDIFDNTIKAQKVLRNGNFFIQKGSVLFNANGSLVK